MTNGRCDRPIERPAMVIVLLIGSSSFLNAYEISVTTQIEERGETLRVRYPQQVELVGDRAIGIKPGVFRLATAKVARSAIVLWHGRLPSNEFERAVHQIELDGEEFGVDFIVEFVALQDHMPLRQNGTGVHLVLRLDQRNDNI